MTARVGALSGTPASSEFSLLLSAALGLCASRAAFPCREFLPAVILLLLDSEQKLEERSSFWTWWFRFRANLLQSSMNKANGSGLFGLNDTALELLPQRPLVFGAFVRQVICLCRLVVMEGDSSSVEEADVLSALLSSTATPSVLTHSDIDPCLCIIRPMPDGDSQVPSSQKESQQCENDIRGKQAWWESPPVGIRMI